MTDHRIDPVHGILHCEAPAPYLDTTIQQNGVTYAGRLYPVQPSQRNAPAEPSQQRTALRSPDGKVLLLYDKAGLYAWSRRWKEWQVFEWETVLRVYYERTGKRP